MANSLKIKHIPSALKDRGFGNSHYTPKAVLALRALQHLINTKDQPHLHHSWERYTAIVTEEMGRKFDLFDLTNFVGVRQCPGE
jgi:hypothetical protein